MLSEKDAVRLSKFISLVLRHKPEVIDLKLDKNGWASVDDLINKSRANEIRFTFEDLKQVVDTNDKMRFSFDPSMQKIRASQGIQSMLT
jgi:putative RNA 2'-phosphotransferase